jgi:hypothetical protein
METMYYIGLDAQENDQLPREGRQPPYPVYHTGSRHNPWMVGNPYLIALRQSCPSLGSNMLQRGN